MFIRPVALLLTACVALSAPGHCAFAARILAANGDGSRSILPAVSTGAWHTLPLFGGTVTAIAVSPVNPGIVLAGIEEGATSGALYESRDGALTWSRVEFPSLPDGGPGYVHDLEFAADGTAHAAARGGLLRRGAGTGAWSVQRSNPDEYFTEASVNPNDPRELWAGGRRGATTLLVHSQDRGVTWTEVTPPAPAVNTTGMAISSTDGRILVVSAGEQTGEVWRSEDGGSSWTMPLSIAGGRFTDVVYDGSRFWASADQQTGTGLWVSFDEGLSWNRLGEALTARRIFDLAADPSQPGLVLVATQRGLHQCYGQLWTLFLGGTVRPLSAVCFVPQDPRRMFIGEETDGVLRSFDGGSMFEPASQGLLGLRIHSVALNPADPREINAAFQAGESGGLFTSLDGGQTWELDPAFTVPVTALEYAPDGTLYVSALQTMTRVRPEGVYRRGSDRAWTPVGPPGQPDRMDFSIACVRVNRFDPRTVILVGLDHSTQALALWRSGDRGDTWERVYSVARSPGAGAYRDLGDIAFVMRASTPAVFATLDDGRMVRSIDDGRSWSPVAGLPAQGPLHWLGTTPADAAALYAVPLAGPLGIVSRDGGESWSSFATGGFTAFTVDPNSPDVVYGTLMQTHDVVRSTNRGVTFGLFGEGAPATDGHEFAWTQGACPTLVYATGVGLYQRDVDSVAPQLSVELDPVVLWPPDGRMHTIRARVAVADGCDDTPSFALSSITVDDSKAAAEDIVATFGPGTLSFQLRAERPGKRARRYVVTYAATDASGNVREATAVVEVPHDRSAADRSDDREQPANETTPRQTRLVSIEPNPFNPSTSVTLTLAQRGHVSLEVYDVRGARVRMLVSGVMPEGEHRVHWDGIGDTGRPAASGVYFFRFVVGGRSQTMKALLIK